MATDPISESAKATQEIGKATTKALEVAQGLGGWLDRMFGEGVEYSVRNIWTNKVRERSIAGAIHSWERLELLLFKAEERLRKKGITQFRLVPPKIALPLLQNATVEEEEDLHSLWAALLATTLNAEAGEVHRKYVSILADLTSADAKVLRKIWSDWQNHDKKQVNWASSTVKYGPGVQGTDGHAETSVITLNRLGLIAPSYTEITTFRPGEDNGYDSPMEESESVQVYGDLLIVIVTPLGEGFCRAVMDSEPALTDAA